MSRAPRVDIANYTYHVLNRSNARLGIFEKETDYQAFENILEEAKDKYKIDLFSYQIMPNHWHMCLSPYRDGEMSRFMQWLTLTHTQRWHAHRYSVGSGHLYQGRYKSFLVQDGEYFLQLCKYIEQNALRARLVNHAEDWRWSSLWRRTYGDYKKKKFLSQWPIEEPPDYVEWVNRFVGDETGGTLEQIRIAIARGKPYGDEAWASQMAGRFNLGMTIRPRGRPVREKGT
jgi:putative transposase